MIDRIQSDKNLVEYCTRTIADAGVEIKVDPTLNENSYIGVKIDDYYSELKEINQPKAVDFVIAVDCRCSAYNLYVLELKGGKNKNYSTKDIYEKFTTTIDDFLKCRYQSIFCDDRYKYKGIYLYLVTTTPAAALKYESYAEYLRIRDKLRRKDTLTIEAEFTKVFSFRGRQCRICREIPPNPVICADY